MSILNKTFVEYDNFVRSYTILNCHSLTKYLIWKIFSIMQTPKALGILRKYIQARVHVSAHPYKLFSNVYEILPMK